MSLLTHAETLALLDEVRALREVAEAAEFVCDRLLSGDTGCVEEAIRGCDDIRSALAKVPR